MKKSLFYLLLVNLLSVISVFSQESDNINLLVEYKLRHVMDTTQPSNPLIRPYLLMVGSRMSKYDDYYRAMSELGTPIRQTITDASGKVITAEVSAGGDQIYLDHAKDQLITVSFVLQSYYAIVEPMPNIQWDIKPQKKVLLNYNCQMAIGSFKGRNYTAWFTTELPSHAGPWKLSGLPGLILFAADDKNEVVFECLNVSQPPANARPITIAKQISRTTKEKLFKVKTALENDQNAGKGVRNNFNSAIGGTIVATGVSTLAPGSKPRRLNNPIEKE